MMAAKLVVLFIVAIFIQQSPKLYASSDPDPETARTSSLSSKLNELRLELQEVVQKNQINKLQPLLATFQAIKASDEEWETWATVNHCVRWFDRHSWQDAVGSHILLMGSIEPIYWGLIAQNVRESIASSEDISLETFSNAIQVVLEEHPVTRKRATMYLLAMIANKYQSPIAQIMTANHLRLLKEESKTANQLLTVARLNAREIFYRNFFEALPTPSTTPEDFAHHFVQLGSGVNPLSDDDSEKYDDVKATKALQYFVKAGKMGDFEGYRKTAQLQKEWMLRNGGCADGINKMLTFLVLSSSLGSPNAENDFDEIISTCPEGMREEAQREWDKLREKISLSRNEIRKKIEEILKAS